jgi:thiamine biosynthesis lipoprotein
VILPEARDRALGSTLVVLTTTSAALPVARDVAIAQIDAIDQACSRFRDDSELSALNAGVGRTVAVSALLRRAVDIALRAAEQTDGLVDPTIGDTLVALGYDRDFRSILPDGPELRGAIPRCRRWREVEVDRARSTVRLPADVSLDLGATAKAFAADLAAAAAAREADTGVLVSIGGDVATAGPAPTGGWTVLVSDDHAREVDPEGQTVAVTSGGVATSGTTVRRWRRGDEVLHHVIDPRTARPARSCWRTVTVAAATCVDANVASTASLVMGERATDWLHQRSLPSRLVRVDGTVERVAGWPEPMVAGRAEGRS